MNLTLKWAVAAGLATAAAALVLRFAWPGGDAALPQQAEVGQNEPFAWADCKPRLFDGSPAIGVVFTQPLDRNQPWAQRLTVTEGDDGKPVAGRWVLGDNPRVLILPHVTPDRTLNIRMRADVTAANGATLGLDASCRVTSEAMPTAFYFASRGVVLPAGQNGGLPVVTVNTPEVDVEFLRVKPESLPAFLAQVGQHRANAGRNADPSEASDPTEGAEFDDDGGYMDPARKLKGTVPGYVLDELQALSTSVYSSRFQTDPRPNRRHTSFLPVERIAPLQEPGVYVAVMKQPGRFGWDHQVTYFYVTDIGLHLRRHAAQTDVFATSLKTGEALKGVALTLVDANGRSLAQVGTDALGHAVFSGSVDAARAMVARRDKDFSVLALRDPALDLSEYDVGGHPSRNHKIMVYAGRDLYRPGESFDASVLVRDTDGHAAAPGQLTPLALTLKQPNGETVSTHLVKPHAAGQAYHQHRVVLPASAATGRWWLEARKDPASRQADTTWGFQVEEFLPERMTLKLQAPEAVLQGPQPLTVDVSGQYLYGAPAAGNRLLATLAVERLALALPQEWPGFLFGDLSDDDARQRQELDETELDAEGLARLEVPVDLGERRSPMRLRTAVSLLESGGRPVVRSLERAWWPAPVLVGIRPLFERHVAPENALAGFELVRADAQGRFAVGKDLRLRLVREDRQWYWRYDDSRGWHSGYTTDEELVDARQINLDRRTTVNLPVRYGRYRLEVHDPGTGQTARYRFHAGWGAQDAEDMGSRPDRVALKLEGAPYKPGDRARLTITPPHDGEALLTVEGDRVLYQTRLKVRARGTVVELPVSPDWNRHDLYVTVAAFRPGHVADRVTPARALGLVHLPLSRESRRLQLSLQAPTRTTPEQTVPVRIRVTDANGQPLNDPRAIVTLSAVDVGILNITRFPTPDPTDFFFGKHRYGADLLDLYGKLIETQEGTPARQRFGGDAGARNTQSLPRKVRLVDLFSGPVVLDAQGQATVPVALPDFNGTLRLMAVASTADRYASAQADMVVAAPLVAELALPRFIAPGDSATLALDLTNLSGQAQTVSVKVASEGPLRISGQHPPVQLAHQQRTVLRFHAEATDAWGLAPIKVTVTAGPLRVVREAALQIQPATPLVREVRRVRLAAGESFKPDPLMTQGFWPGSARVDLMLSNRPPIDVRAAVQGLLMYPYGCLEQTTSSAYPLVFIDEAGATAQGMKPLSREARAQRLDTAFARLAGMQQPQGGFGLWAAGNPYEGWLSAYVTGFLQDAHEAGFSVPQPLLQRATQSLLEQLQKAPGLQTRPPKDLARNADGRLSDPRVADSLRTAHQRLAEAAHAGYILARAQKAPLATLRSLHDDWRANARSPLVLVHLGLALKLMGDEARAQVALDEAFKRPYGLNPGTSSPAWEEWLGDYGSPLRDHAMAYALLHRHQVAHPQRENLLQELANTIDQRQYLSTQEKLSLFLAARAAGGQTGAPWQARLQAGTTVTALGGQAPDRRSLEPGSLPRGVVVTNTGTDLLFAEVAAEGHALKPLPPRDDRIALERSWWTPDGKPLTGRSFKTGDLVVVRLKVNARQRIKDALVVERVPAGMEVENLNLSQGPRAGEFTIDGLNVGEALADPRVKHREFRDDRFVAAADLRDGPLNLFYLLRVVTPGTFTVPAPFAEDMYRPDVRGVGKAEAPITVVDPRGR